MAFKKRKTSIKDRKIFILVSFAIFLVALVILLCIFKNNYSNRKQNDDRKKTEVLSAEEIKSRLGINLSMSATNSEANYFIEDEDIARIEYDARGMHFILKSSSDSRKTLANITQQWDIPILMNSICKDGTEIEVNASLSLDDPSIMKAEWYDNDLYYAMLTKNLTTREEFLQEVNRIIIEYHES